jgi:hypothetical protein
VKINYQGKKRGLKEIVEFMVMNKRSNLYKNLPAGVVEGKDFRQDALVNLVRQFENTAYDLMMQEFPQIEKETLRRNNSIKKAARDNLDAFLNN